MPDVLIMKIRQSRCQALNPCSEIQGKLGIFWVDPFGDIRVGVVEKCFEVVITHRGHKNKYLMTITADVFLILCNISDDVWMKQFFQYLDLLADML
jgi:hypothetical protein